MSHIHLTTKEELAETVEEAVGKALRNELPQVIRKASRKKWMTTKEVAQFLGVSIRQVHYYKDSGQLPYFQNNRSVRFDVDDVEDFLNRGKVNPDVSIREKYGKE